MFASCEHNAMTETSPTPISEISELRKELGLTLEEFGARVGLKSKGQVSEIERAGTCSPEVALAIEALSERRLNAAALNPIIAAARRGIAA